MELCFCQWGSCEKRQSTDDIVLVEYMKYDYGVVVEVEGKALVYNSVLFGLTITYVLLLHQYMRLRCGMALCVAWRKPL